MLALKVDPTTLADLRTMEDGTDFYLVRAYFDDPTTPIKQVGIVQEGFDLCEVAAVLVNPQATEADLKNLLESGALKYAVPFIKESYDLPWRREHCIRMSEIKDRQRCDVLYIPPLYLCKLRRHHA